jgi:hypothetical protein
MLKNGELRILLVNLINFMFAIERIRSNVNVQQFFLCSKNALKEAFSTWHTCWQMGTRTLDRCCTVTWCSQLRLRRQN